ncbi:hypothetical protein [Croceitalea rosinachiae]|uniref:Lipoprotein n=1 Tax=Croceitalea rosinachiae TaxID=3075596 RepID=A0ABU3AD42_9FLAO|nr:hypothetical protein [Croceitalea sp. F388]MDT0607904.1 hypothetical protein [Croceitalea sp. F388]
MKKVYLFIPLLIFDISCSDISKRYSNGIEYVHEGEGYKYILKDNFHGLFLESNVESVKENDDYILFLQSIQKDRIRYNVLSDFYPSEIDLDSILKIGSIARKVDSTINDVPHLFKQMQFKRAYWVLEKSSDSLLGPFSTSDFRFNSYNF